MLLNCTPIEFPFNIYSRPKLLASFGQLGRTLRTPGSDCLHKRHASTGMKTKFLFKLEEIPQERQ